LKNSGIWRGTEGIPATVSRKHLHCTISASENWRGKAGSKERARLCLWGGPRFEGSNRNYEDESKETFHTRLSEPQKSGGKEKAHCPLKRGIIPGRMDHGKKEGRKKKNWEKR